MNDRSYTKNFYLHVYRHFFEVSYIATTLVHPHLEYGNVIWGPFYTLDQIKIENVQRMATRMVVSIKHLSYEQRL